MEICIATFLYIQIVNNPWDKKVAACVNFTPACMRAFYPELVHKLNRKEIIFMDFDFEFDELDELEIMDLLDQKN